MLRLKLYLLASVSYQPNESVATDSQIFFLSKPCLNLLTPRMLEHKVFW